MFTTGLFVIHDASAGGQHDVATTRDDILVRLAAKGDSSDSPELTRWEQCVCPLLDVKDGNVEARADDTSFVESSGKIDDDLSCAVIIDNFEFSDVAVLHHDCEEFNDDLRIGANEDLTFASFLGIVDAFQSIR